MLYPFTRQPAKFKYTFAVAWLIPKGNLLFAKRSSGLKYINVRMALRLLIWFYGLICSSFGSRSEQPRALQLLIKMLIRLCLKWEGFVFLYFYMQNSLKLAKPLSVRLMKYSNRNPWSISYLSINIFMPRLLHHLTTERANWNLNLHRFGNKKIEFLVSLTTRQY